VPVKELHCWNFHQILSEHDYRGRNNEGKKLHPRRFLVNQRSNENKAVFDYRRESCRLRSLPSVISGLGSLFDNIISISRQRLRACDFI
jgi:hypothetical protein